MLTRKFVVAFGLFVFVFPAIAPAQYCPDPIVVECGDQISGNTTGGTSALAEYSCLDWQWTGPEDSYLLVLDQCTYVEITATPTGFDAALVVLPGIWGVCRADYCMGGSDVGLTGGAESLYGDIGPGNFYVVIDGYFYGYGPYVLDIQCTPYPDCTDADGDGRFAIDAACPCGDDCDDNDPDRYPYAREICEDGVDQDCNSVDATCPNCAATHTLQCDQSGSTNLSGLANNFSDYCQLGWNGWTGPEAIFEITPASDMGIRFTTTEPQDIDIIVLLSFADGVCNPDVCLNNSTAEYTGDEQVVFTGLAGRTYYVVVDGWDGVSPSFDWTASCFDEVCTNQDSISCGDSLSASSSGQANNVNVYNGLPYDMPAPEYVYTFAPNMDGLVTVSLTFQSGIDLALIVVEESDGACNPANGIAVSDLDNTNIQTETVTFQVAAGVTYYLVVDGWTAGDQGPFTISAECTSVCPAGTIGCFGVCVDTDSDPNHCGGCGNACILANAMAACQAGGCVIESCLPGFDDCNVNPADGCEDDLTGSAHCGSCNNACTGQEFCWEGSCTDQCPGGLTNCSAQCVDTGTDPSHCGGCDQACSYNHATPVCNGGFCELGACAADWDNCDLDPANGCEIDLLNHPDHCGACNDACPVATPFCVNGGCTDQCPGGLTNCSGICVDTETDPQHCGDCDSPCSHPNAQSQCASGICSLVVCDPGWANCNPDEGDGCEVPLGNVANCTGCGDSCVYPNATGECTPDGCALAACDPGFHDCNAGDGCETELGTAQNCSGCDDACEFDHADGACVDGACEMGDCRASFADCNSNPTDGCEASLNSDATCGSCDNACDPTFSCSNGECVSDCQDRDGDGFQDSACGGSDCNDTDGTVHPGATETCGDGIDQDCDGEDLPCGGCHDDDGDGYGDGCASGSDCNDADGAVHPGAAEICEDGIDQDCDGEDLPCGECRDNDGDGHLPLDCGGLDCDDTNPNISPEAIDFCGDGIDQDCKGGDQPCPEESSCGCGRSSPASPAALLLGLAALVEYRRRRRL